MNRVLRVLRYVGQKGVRRIHEQFEETSFSSRQRGPTNLPETFRSLREQTQYKSKFHADDVTDHGELGFVADPFLFEKDGLLHLFFEVFSPCRDPTAAIGHAVSKDGGSEWTYTGLALETEHHLSFPYVFSKDKTVYMVPDIANSEGFFAPVRIYQATSFPAEWEPIAEIVDTRRKKLDTVVFQWNSIWWAIMGSSSNDETHVYYSETLLGSEWTPHPENPVVVGRPRAARPGGRPFIHEGEILLPFQDCATSYGDGLNIHRLTTLNKSRYNDEPLFDEPLLTGTGRFGWNSGRMHHLDICSTENGFVCAVDGDVGIGRCSITGSLWSIRIC